jgi:hypothetical protein
VSRSAGGNFQAAAAYPVDIRFAKEYTFAIGEPILSDGVRVILKNGVAERDFSGFEIPDGAEIVERDGETYRVSQQPLKSRTARKSRTGRRNLRGFATTPRFTFISNEETARIINLTRKISKRKRPA